MRAALAGAVLLGALAGCAFFSPYGEQVVTVEPAACKPLPETVKAGCLQAADVLTKGYATLAGFNGQIKLKVSNGIYTKAQAQEYLDKSVSARKQLDRARDAFSNGNYSAALSEANITSQLIGLLEKELAKQVAKEQK